MTTAIDDALSERTERLIARLVSPTTGLLKRAQLLPVCGGQVRYSHFVGAPAHYSVLPTGGDIANPGGSAWDRRVSLAQVVFEAIERYCAAFVDHSSLLRAAPLGPPFQPGGEIQRFAAFQYDQAGFPYVSLQADSLVHWAVGRSLITGNRVFVPAVFTYLPYQPASPAEVLGPSMSTGMAAAWEHDDACLNGLLELVERDAFTITWMNRLRGTRLIPCPGSTLAHRVDMVEANHSSVVSFVDVTTDIGIPVVCCLMQSSAFGQPLVTVGLSCKMSEANACDKALGEALSDYERLRTLLADPDAPAWAPGHDFENVVDFELHGRFYVDPTFQPQLDFLLDTTADVEIDGEFRSAQPSDLLEALQCVEPFVSDVLMVDLTTREIEELGVAVVKVFSPELVPLNADHRYPYLGHERLHNAGGRHPGRSMASFLTTANCYPHPFS